MVRVRVKDIDGLMESIGMRYSTDEGKGSHRMAIDDASNIKVTIPTHDGDLGPAVINSILTSINLVHYLHTKTYLANDSGISNNSKPLVEALQSIKNRCDENPMQIFTSKQRNFYNIRSREQASSQIDKLMKQVSQYYQANSLQNIEIQPLQSPTHNNTHNSELCKS